MDYKPPKNTGLDIVHCDDSLLIVEKPSALLSVPGRGPDKQDSLSMRVQHVYPEALIVHRLDMSTSGLFLMARDKQTQTLISQMFEQRKVSKTYIAIVSGVPQNNCGSIDLPLMADWPNRPKQKVDPLNGKQSMTHYRLIEAAADAKSSRLELTPLTGRSHQLRVHLLAIGHPILGDDLYADPETKAMSPRLLLHAQELKFQHPINKQTLCVESPTPF